MNTKIANVISGFPKEYFRCPPRVGMEFFRGALLFKPDSLTADQVYELLELVYSKPNFDPGDIRFIDRKNTWRWVFETANGFLSCYDYKGGWSIGYIHKETDELRNDAKKLFETIKKFCLDLEKAQREVLLEEKNHPLINFVRSIGAVRRLLLKAHDEGSLLEGIVLYAALTDGLLRIALVLDKQIKDRTSDIEETYIFQKDRTYIKEREIFSLAYVASIISKKLFNEVSFLYDKRNEAVHGFVITHIEYVDIAPILIRYEKVYDELYQVIYNLEAKQISLGIGMTVPGTTIEEDKDEIEKDILKKIDSTRKMIKKQPRKYLFPEDSEDPWM